MPSPSEVFRVRDKVHVLCPITKIWEEARVTSFESSWKVRIEFDNWAGKHKKTLVQVHPNQHQEDWEIRRPIQTGLLSFNYLEKTDTF